MTKTVYYITRREYDGKFNASKGVMRTDTITHYAWSAGSTTHTRQVSLARDFAVVGIGYNTPELALAAIGAYDKTNNPGKKGGTLNIVQEGF